MRYPETAALIRSARRRKGISQATAAANIGCSRLQVIRWEQGLHRPDPLGLGPVVADVLGIEPSRLASADEDDDEEAAAVRDLARALQAEVRRQVHAALERSLS